MEIYQLFVIFTVLTSYFLTEAKTYRTCELARALDNEGIPRVLISNYVCLAEAVSGSNTNKVTNSTPTSSEYGIFQINTKEFCGKNGKAGGKCNILCEKLLDDPIKDDIQCAKKIQTEHGFKYWNRWNVRCKSTSPTDYNRYLPNLFNCFNRN